MNYFSIAIWVIISLFLPGALLLYALPSRFTGGSKKYLSPHLILPFSFSLSVALISVLGWLGYFLRLNFLFVERSLLAIIILLILIVLFTRKQDIKASYKNLKIRTDKTNFVQNNPDHELGNRLRKIKTWQVWIWVLAISAGLLSAWVGPWMSHTADTFGHLSAIRSVIVYNNPLPQEIFFPAHVTAMSPNFGTWNLALGIVTDLAHADVIHVWRFINVLLAPILVLALFSLSLSLTRRMDAAFLSTLLFLVLEQKLDLRTLAYPNKMGQILMWLATIAVIQCAQYDRDNKSGPTEHDDIRHRVDDIRNLVFVALLAFGASTVHMQYAPVLMLLVGLGLVIIIISRNRNAINTWVRAKIVDRLFFNKPSAIDLSEDTSDPMRNNRRDFRLSILSFTRGMQGWRIFYAGSIAIIASLLPFTYKTVQMLSFPSVKVTETSAIGLESFDLWFSSLESMIPLLSVLALGLFIIWPKHTYGSAIVVGSTISLPLLVLFSHLVIGQGGTWNTLIQRFIRLIPAFLSIGLGWQIIESTQYIKKYFSTNRFTTNLILPILVVVFSGFYIVESLDGPISLYSPSSTYNYNTSVSHNGDLTVVWADAITEIQALPEDSVIFSDLSTSYMLNGLTGRRVVSLLQQHTSLWDKEINNQGIFDVIDFSAGRLNELGEIDALIENNVTHVLISKNQTPGIWDRVHTISALELIDEGIDWRLYRFNADAVDEYLDFVDRKKLATSTVDIIELYRSAEKLFPNKKQYAEAAGTQTNIPQEIVLNFLAKGDVYESAWEPGSVYNFLGQLKNSEVLDSYNPDYIRQAVFIFDTVPYGVLFQHAPSQISFEVAVPPRAWIQFAPVIAPEVWQFGRGDGVQFTIDLKTSDQKNYRIYDAYLDPKNLTSQRKLDFEAIGLSHWADETGTITFTTGCGPNEDCRFDWAGWAEPRLMQPVAYQFIDHFSEAQVDLLGSETGQAQILAQTINYDTRDILFQHPASQVTYSLSLPARSTLQFGLGVAPEAWDAESSDGVEYNLYVRTPDNPHRLYRVYQQFVDPKNNPEDRQWFEGRVNLDKFGGQTVDIIFEALPGPAGNYNFDWGGWSMPVLIDETIPGEISHQMPDVVTNTP